MRLDFFEISWIDENGEERTERLAPGGVLRMRVCRGRKQAILARPSSEDRTFMPAGAFYPASVVVDSGNSSEKYDMLKPSFREGYAVCVARCLENAGLYPYRYNLDKLLTAAISSLRDPWSLAPWEAALALAEGRFRAGMFPEAKMKVALPRGRSWLPESPFALVGTEGGTATATLAPGIHLFHSEGESLLVSVSDDGAVLQAIGRGNMSDCAARGLWSFEEGGDFPQ